MSIPQALMITYHSAKWTLVDLGTDGGAAGAATSKTITCSAGVPAGSLICVAYGNTGTAFQPSIADSGGNTWTNKISAAAHTAGLFYCFNSLVIAAGGTIVVSSGSAIVYGVTAFYTGDAQKSSDPFDAAVFKTSSGTGNISLTSGIPAVANELFVGFNVGHGAAGNTWTLGAGWTTPFDAVRQTLNPQSFGGHEVNTGVGTLAYVATQSAGTISWEALVAGFKHS